MSGETDVTRLLKTMTSKLNTGDYVFCTVPEIGSVNDGDIIGSFKEAEGWTVILDKQAADRLNLNFSYIAAWITLTVHSSLEAIGLTAAFAQ